jgi:hypothetical protein
MCVRARQSRCSTATAETANDPVALLSLPASLSWYRTQRLPVRRRRTRFVLAAVVSRLAAFAPIVALLYSRVAKLLQDSCPSAFPRWTISRSFSRCWTSGHPVRNRGFALVRQFLTILNRPSSSPATCNHDRRGARRRKHTDYFSKAPRVTVRVNAGASHLATLAKPNFPLLRGMRARAGHSTFR